MNCLDCDRRLQPSSDKPPRYYCRSCGVLYADKTIAIITKIADRFWVGDYFYAEDTTIYIYRDYDFSPSQMTKHQFAGIVLPKRFKKLLPLL